MRVHAHGACASPRRRRRRRPPSARVRVGVRRVGQRCRGGLRRPAGGGRRRPRARWGVAVGRPRERRAARRRTRRRARWWPGSRSARRRRRRRPGRLPRPRRDGQRVVGRRCAGRRGGRGRPADQCRGGAGRLGRRRAAWRGASGDSPGRPGDASVRIDSRDLAQGCRRLERTGTPRPRIEEVGTTANYNPAAINGGEFARLTIRCSDDQEDGCGSMVRAYALGREVGRTRVSASVGRDTRVVGVTPAPVLPPRGRRALRGQRRLPRRHSRCSRPAARPACSSDVLRLRQRVLLTTGDDRGTDTIGFAASDAGSLSAQG